MIPVINPENISLNVLPPSKHSELREDGTTFTFFRFIQWFKGIQGNAVRLYGIFSDFVYGSTVAYWNNATTYAKGRKVMTSFGVYESQESNAATFPVGSSKWLYVAPNLGIQERIRFKASRIVLEMALNRQFRKELSDNGFVGFRQPTSYSGTGQLPLSDIYISALPPEYVSFAFSSATQSLGGINTVSSTNGLATISIIGAASSYKFQINIPVSVYASINSNATIAEKIVRNFVDRYCAVGIEYEIATY